MESVCSWAVSSLGIATFSLNDRVSGLISVVSSLLLNSSSNGPLAQRLPRLLKSQDSSIAPPRGSLNIRRSGPQAFSNTSVTSHYDFSVARGVVAPDGTNNKIHMAIKLVPRSE